MNAKKPGTKEWLDAKRGGPRWEWTTSGGGMTVQGYMQDVMDHGGTDITYLMRRDPCGTLDLVSGARAKEMKRV